MASAGISTLGITFGYGVETTAGTKPTSFKQLTRINSIGGITIENEQIDASAVEDFITRCTNEELKGLAKKAIDKLMHLEKEPDNDTVFVFYDLISFLHVSVSAFPFAYPYYSAPPLQCKLSFSSRVSAEPLRSCPISPTPFSAQIPEPPAQTC